MINPMTEAEAKKRLCPFNPSPQAAKGMFPWKGSECMAWQTFLVERKTFVADDPCATREPDRPSVVPADWEFDPYKEGFDDPAEWVEPYDQAKARQEGYCGMITG